MYLKYNVILKHGMLIEFFLTNFTNKNTLMLIIIVLDIQKNSNFYLLLKHEHTKLFTYQCQRS